MLYVLLCPTSRVLSITTSLKVAAAKGLIAGTFTITRTDRTILDYASEAEVDNESFSLDSCL